MNLLERYYVHKMHKLIQDISQVSINVAHNTHITMYVNVHGMTLNFTKFISKYQVDSMHDNVDDFNNYRYTNHVDIALLAAFTMQHSSTYKKLLNLFTAKRKLEIGETFISGNIVIHNHHIIGYKMYIMPEHTYDIYTSGYKVLDGDILSQSKDVIDDRYISMTDETRILTAKSYLDLVDQLNTK